MTKGKLAIHSENILPIIKKWLYSDKDIFIRELISNACDAISKLRILRDEEKLAITDQEFRIDINIDKENKTLTFSDTGIGMDEEEITKYIAQIAFSGAEEFMQKYKTQEEKDQFIGHFGLGFYSSYMVAKIVTIDTLSYKKDSKPVFWSCDGSSEYEILEGNQTSRGTRITLHIDENAEEYLEEERIRQIIKQYCSYLPFPIYLNDNHINNKDPLWIQKASDLSEKEYLEFYRELYPMEPDPLFWIHLNVDYPFHLKGVLYFPKLHKRFDFQKNSIKLYCNRVFVSDNCKDLLPDYLMVLRGAIDSPDIPLNVSRSYLQMDKTVKSLGSHISKKISDKLKQLYQNDREKFISHWEDIEMIIKLGILQDDKFYDRSKEFLIWKNSKGEWTTLDEYLDKSSDKTIYYNHEEKSEPQILELFRKKEIDVLLTNGVIDTPLINHLESKLDQVVFKRIDSSLDDSLLDKTREKTVLGADGKSEAGAIADFIRSSIDINDLEVEAKSLASNEIPALFVFDEQARRLRDFMMTHGDDKTPTLPSKRTFIVNTNNKIIQKAYALKNTHPELSQEMIKQTYDMALLGQKELDLKDLSKVIERNNQVIEKLTELVSS